MLTRSPTLTASVAVCTRLRPMNTRPSSTASASPPARATMAPTVAPSFARTLQTMAIDQRTIPITFFDCRAMAMASFKLSKRTRDPGRPKRVTLGISSSCERT